MKYNRSESITNLAAALAVAQGQIKTAPKSLEASVKTKSGATYKYRYSSLDDIWESCRKPLTDNKLSVIQLPSNNEDGFFLETILLHESGEFISSSMKLPVSADRMSAIQAMGSAITYARRYMLGAIVGVTSGEDDDGQIAGQIATQQQALVEQPPPAPTMDMTKLLENLEKIDKIKGFYKSEDSVKICLSSGREIPNKYDIHGWRQLFKDARDYALAQLEQNNEAIPEVLDESDYLEEEYPEIYNDS